MSMAITYLRLEPRADEQFIRIPRAPGGTVAPAMGISTLAAGDMGSSDEYGRPARRELLRFLGVDPGKLVSLKQEHTKLVHTAEAAGPGVRGDGIITSDPDRTLGVTVADCLPIFLYHSQKTVFGIVHSGWKGTGIAAEAVSMMAKNYGIAPEMISAVIGPGIGPCCYRVDEKRAEYFIKHYGGSAVQNGRNLDLKAVNAALLSEAGVGNIAVCTDCTSCSPRFGSFRREGPDSFTRMIALINFLV